MSLPFEQVYRDIAREFRFEKQSIFYARSLADSQIGGLASGSELWLSWVVNVAAPLIYRHHYLRQPKAGTDRGRQVELRNWEDKAFADSLSEANRGSGVAESGWVISTPLGKDVVCERRGVRVRVPSSAILQSADNTVSLRFPSERRYAMAQFYSSIVGTEMPIDLRIYFHVKADWAIRFVEVLTGEADALGVSYRFKILNHPESFNRPDSALLYLNRADIEMGRALVNRIVEEVPGALRISVPSLVRRWRPGIGVADEPAEGGSFGEHRSRILARGLAKAIAAQRRDVDEVVQCLMDELRRCGIDPGRPYSSGTSSSAEIF